MLFCITFLLFLLTHMMQYSRQGERIDNPVEWYPADPRGGVLRYPDYHGCCILPFFEHGAPKGNT